MRVIGGLSRGRRLPARLPAGVRPTSDRVREAIFDVLGSMGGVDGLRVADLFCGSGALGAEALSRGAAEVTLVDHHPDALAAVRANLAAAGLDRLAGQRAVVVRAELPAWLGRAGSFDLALCDPPYAFADWGTLLGSLRAEVAVLESSSEVEVPGGWAVTRARRYGGTLVTVVRTAAHAAPAARPPSPVAVP
ncbi:MAG: RsmD family RNA methyltransferase [Acidimicrobiales bacterium]